MSAYRCVRISAPLWLSSVASDFTKRTRPSRPLVPRKKSRRRAVAAGTGAPGGAFVAARVLLQGPSGGRTKATGNNRVLLPCLSVCGITVWTVAGKHDVLLGKLAPADARHLAPIARHRFVPHRQKRHRRQVRRIGRARPRLPLVALEGHHLRRAQLHLEVRLALVECRHRLGNACVRREQRPIGRRRRRHGLFVAGASLVLTHQPRRLGHDRVAQDANDRGSVVPNVKPSKRRCLARRVGGGRGPARGHTYPLSRRRQPVRRRGGCLGRRTPRLVHNGRKLRVGERWGARERRAIVEKGRQGRTAKTAGTAGGSNCKTHAAELQGTGWNGLEVARMAC